MNCIVYLARKEKWHDIKIRALVIIQLDSANYQTRYCYESTVVWTDYQTRNCNQWTISATSIQVQSIVLCGLLSDGIVWPVNYTLRLIIRFSQLNYVRGWLSGSDSWTTYADDYLVDNVISQLYWVADIKLVLQLSVLAFIIKTSVPLI